MIESFPIVHFIAGILCGYFFARWVKSLGEPSNMPVTDEDRYDWTENRLRIYSDREHN